MICKKIGWSVGVLAVGIGTVFGQTNYVVYKAAKPIAVDGKITAEEWARAPWSDPFNDIEGKSKPKPLYSTRVKMLWDEHYFYIAAALEEPHVWATLKEHDSVIFQDNDFEVFIDPDADQNNYYEFEMNALNTTWDLRLTKPYLHGGKALNEWEIAGLKTAVKIHGTLNDPRDKDDGWTIELAIPWKALSEFSKQEFPPREGDRLQLNYSRVEWLTTIENGKYVKVPKKPEFNWTWGAQPAINMHIPEAWPFVTFSNATGK
jgi:hypothetical protein